MGHVASLGYRNPEVALCAAGELFGGVERHLLGMCAWLQRNGHRPRLILMNDRELAAQARASGVEPFIIASRNPLDLSGPRRLAGVLAAEGVNVVHCHGERAAVNAALARRLHPFQLVRTMHGAIEPSRILSVKGLKDRLYPWLERVIAGPRTAVVCYVTADLRRHWLAEERGENSQVLYNGLDPLDRGRYRQPDDWNAGDVNLVLIGRVSAVKGIPFAIEAMSRLREHARLRLHIIGSGPAEAECRKLAAELDVLEQVRFLGFRQNVHDYMAHATALLMPSLHEGLPYTILEAMSLALPIIASDVGGLREILEDRRTARLVPVGDVPALTGAIAEVVMDPLAASAMGARARVHQAANLDLDAMGRSHWDLYRRLTSGE